MTTKDKENDERNGDVPKNFTEWITEELENTEDDDFVSEDEKVLPAPITNDSENTNQDDFCKVASRSRSWWDTPHATNGI